MKTKFTLILFLFGAISISLYSETLKVYPVADGYTTPIAGGNNVKTSQPLPRMADRNTKPVMRFDLFFFAADNPELNETDIMKAEIVVVSVLEGGPTGTSRRLSDANVTAYETDNNWMTNQIVAEPFEIEPAISDPVYFPSMGPNPYQGSTDPVTDFSFIIAYETPLRIDITNFFKMKLSDPDKHEFSISLIKEQEAGSSLEYTRMGGLINENEEFRPRIEVTLASTGLSDMHLSTFKTWTNQGYVYVLGEAGIYTLMSLTGEVIETIKLNNQDVDKFKTNLNSGVYIIQMNSGSFVSSSKIIL
jgi:hypothetical protein